MNPLKADAALLAARAMDVPLHTARMLIEWAQCARNDADSGFVRAFVRGDLMLTVAAADQRTRDRLAAVCSWTRTFLPHDAFGRPECETDWPRTVALRRLLSNPRLDAND